MKHANILYKIVSLAFLVHRQGLTDYTRNCYHFSCMVSEYVRTVPHGVEYFIENLAYFLRSCEDSFCDLNTFEPEIIISIVSN